MTDTANIAKRPPNPWKPEKDPRKLRVLGKLGEELGECVSAVCRSIIQGFREFHPVTKKPNKLWLEEELADVYASADLTIEELKLDTAHIMERAKAKKAYLKEWLKEAQDD
jgi:hypothetical protein